MRAIFATTLLSTANAAWMSHVSGGFSDLSSWYDFMSNNPYGFTNHTPHEDHEEESPQVPPAKAEPENDNTN